MPDKKKYIVVLLPETGGQFIHDSGVIQTLENQPLTIQPLMGALPPKEIQIEAESSAINNSIVSFSSYSAEIPLVDNDDLVPLSPPVIVAAFHLNNISGFYEVPGWVKESSI